MSEIIEKKKIRMLNFIPPAGYRFVEYPQQATVTRTKDGWYISHDPIILEMKIPDVLSQLKA